MPRNGLFGISGLAGGLCCIGFEYSLKLGVKSFSSVGQGVAKIAAVDRHSVIRPSDMAFISGGLLTCGGIDPQRFGIYADRRNSHLLRSLPLSFSLI